jgi:hypothetical protein
VRAVILTDTQQTLLPFSFFLSFSTIPSQKRTGWSINDDVVMARVDLATGLLFFLAWSSFLFVSAHPPQTSSGNKESWASFFFNSFDFIKFFYYALAASYIKRKSPEY